VNDCCVVPALAETRTEVLSETESVCPVCLARLPAARVRRGENVYLQKACPAHGVFEAVIWRGAPDFESWVRYKIASYPETPFTQTDKGCPFDCGLCPEHRQQSCCVLLEVTARCDLGCPVCFAAAAGGGANQTAQPPDPDLAQIERWYRRLLAAGGPFNIQLSGGEPCLRDDLPEIITLGRSLGFTFFQLNTNGLRLARDAAYLDRLVAAGLSTVFLQFDGLDDAVYTQLRGRALFTQKQAALAQCARAGVGVMLVPTLVPGVNTNQIGAIVRFALQHAPAVRGVHFQPVSYFGRYPQPPTDAARFTLPEVIRALESQTEGALSADSFVPPGGENALCSFHGNFVLMPDGKLMPLTRQAGEAGSCCAPAPAKEGAAKSRAFVAQHWSASRPWPAAPQTATSGPSFGEWDIFLARAQTHHFCISGMVFQDAWTLDLERLRDCYIHTASADDRLIPFCAYNLTTQAGQPLYRRALTHSTA
jgi:7,8-dihydro-6-hydroxymethylpterin dimethyltransferase